MQPDPGLFDGRIDADSYAARARQIVGSLSDPEQFYPSESTDVSSWIQEWDFRKAKIDVYTHQIHRYPAMFIPQLIRKILLAYSQVGDTVVDIFNGSGTTTVECLLTDRNGIGIEINPLAVMISRVKTTLVDPQLLIAGFERIVSLYGDSDFEYHLVDFPNIDKWFVPSSIRWLSKLLAAIEDQDNPTVSEAFKVAFSDIIRYVSVVRHNGFKLHADPKKKSKEWTNIDILDRFSESVATLIRALTDLWNKGISTESKILAQDSTTKIRELAEVADLVLTSPPYGDSHTTVAYGQFSRLSAQWLGLIGTTERGGIRNVDSELLGGVYKGIDIEDPILGRSITLNTSIMGLLHATAELPSDEKKKARNRIREVIAFYRDLEETIGNGSYYLKPNKSFVLVTGSRVVRGIKLNTDLIIAELGEHHGLLLDGILYRKSIPNKRMPSKVSPTNVSGETAPTMTKESIIILRKAKL